MCAVVIDSGKIEPMKKIYTKKASGNPLKIWTAKWMRLDPQVDTNEVLRKKRK